MSGTLNKALKKLHDLPLNKAHVVLWIIKRQLQGGLATYRVASVKIEKALQRKLIGVVTRAVKSSNQVHEYEFLSEDHDADVTLTVRLSDTDLGSIAKQISNGSDNPHIENAQQLFDSWAYAVELHIGDERILAVRKIPEGWKLKQKDSTLRVMFQNRMLLDYEDADIFRLDKQIDFFSYDGLVFILDKKKFEMAMNFRAGMEKSRDAVLGDLKNLGVVNEIEIIRVRVGTRLSLLRRMAMISKNGYYKKTDFIVRLKAVCTERKWPVAFEGDRIVVTDENVEVVLKLLNNDRLASPVTEEVFDVSVKKKVEA
jgi:hypothetical protein